jgi:hypothetical protein
LGTLIAIIGDTHVGGSTALAVHEYEYDTGDDNEDGTPITQKFTATLAQDWLYEKWLDFWRYVWTLKTEGNHRLLVIHMGDIVDGNHHHTVQAIPYLSVQADMAVQIMLPVANMADRGLYILRGTEAHAGEAAQTEAGIAQALGAKQCAWELILDVDGLILDLAHHGRAGRREYTSAAASVATEAQVDAAQEGRPIPRYVFRAHTHTIDDSGEKVKGTRAFSCPSWQLKTAFGHRIASGRRADIGGVIILPDGSLDLSRIRYTAAPGQRKLVKA